VLSEAGDLLLVHCEVEATVVGGEFDVDDPLAENGVELYADS